MTATCPIHIVSHCRRAGRALAVAFVHVLLLLCAPDAKALNPALTLAQYHHTTWGPKQGLDGRVLTIAQTDDGYLWLGTSVGLVRFDGVTFEPIRALGGVTIGTPVVLALTPEPGGGLWIGYGGLGGGHFSRGVYQAYGPDQGWSSVRQVLVDLEGRTWLVRNDRIGLFDSGRFREVVTSDSKSVGPVSHLLMDRQGTVWIVAMGLIYYVHRGERTFSAVPRNHDGTLVEAVTSGPDGTLFASGADGLWEIHAGLDRPVSLTRLSVRPTGRILIDRDGGAWLATTEGLAHFGAPLRQLLPSQITALQRDLLPECEELGILEDRNGNVWIGTPFGLERFRDTKFVPMTLPGRKFGFAIAAADQGAIWATTIGPGTRLLRVSPDQIETVGQASGLTLYVDADKTLWSGSSPIIYRKRVGRPLEKFVDSKQTVTDFVRAMTTDSTGALWVGMGEGSPVARYAEGRWSNPAGEHGLPDRWGTRTMFTDAGGRVWFGLSTQILLMENGEARRLDKNSNGLDIGSVTVIAQHDVHIWAGGTGGIALLVHDRFHSIRRSGDVPFGSITGIVETNSGDLWFNTASGAFRIPAIEVAAFESDFSHTVFADRFDERDGLYGSPGAGSARPGLVQASDGRLWFATSYGVAWIQPNHLVRNTSFPQTYVQSITVDDHRYDAGSAGSIPEQSRRFQIAYTATALGVPESVRFRYKLEGVDADWQLAGTRRTAFYNDIAPGAHRFLVEATNEEGDWGNSVASLSFFIRPAWFQTSWFQATATLLTLLLGWATYRWRLQRARRQLRMQLRGPQIERERIARELHDTLLQSFQGLVWRFHALAQKLPATDPVRSGLDLTLEVADRSLREGRERIFALRVMPDTAASLSESLTDLGRSLEAEHSATFSLRVIGEERASLPHVQQELYGLMREALLNAYRHANATTINIELGYSQRGLALKLIDDGMGIEPAILESGRTGHFGLSSMREHAEQIGADLSVTSERGAGTEVRVWIGKRRAFGASNWWSRRRA